MEKLAYVYGVQRAVEVLGLAKHAQTPRDEYMLGKRQPATAMGGAGTTNAPHQEGLLGPDLPEQVAAEKHRGDVQAAQLHNVSQHRRLSDAIPETIGKGDPFASAPKTPEPVISAPSTAQPGAPGTDRSQYMLGKQAPATGLGGGDIPASPIFSGPGRQPSTPGQAAPQEGLLGPNLPQQLAEQKQRTGAQDVAMHRLRSQNRSEYGGRERTHGRTGMEMAGVGQPRQQMQYSPEWGVGTKTAPSPFQPKPKMPGPRMSVAPGTQ
jgi:hypothetical protein